MSHSILSDGRWQGMHGIARFSTEVLSRLQNTDILTKGPAPLSLYNLIWQNRLLSQQKNHYKVFYSPGFNPTLLPSMPVVFTLHDLVHLSHPEKSAWKMKLYYEWIMKPAVRKAAKIVTVSHFSKNAIADWANIPLAKIEVVGNGVSAAFKPEGPHFSPGFPYLLHVGNNTKPHKNITRLIQAFKSARIDPGIRLIFTGKPSDDLLKWIAEKKIQNRILFRSLSEDELAEYYRGALAVVFPSLYEGFGLPVIEAMASGTPVLTSKTTALPEVAGEAALLVDPLNTNAIAVGIQQITENVLRKSLIEKGLKRAADFSWEKTAAAVQEVLNGVIANSLLV